MNYKYRILFEETLREIVRNKISLFFSSLILVVLSTIYFISLSYSINIFNSQKLFYANNPIYSILSDDVANDDLNFLIKLLKENFKTENINTVNDSKLTADFWSELGVSKKEILSLGFKFPTIIRIVYDEEISTLEINSAIDRFQEESTIVTSFVYNDEGFKASVKLWDKTKSHALFYIFSSLFSLVFLVFILLGFLVLNKKENLKILDYLGASDRFSLIPLFLYALTAFVSSGIIGIIISGQIKKVFNIVNDSNVNAYLFFSYILVFVVCYTCFPFFVNRIIRDENA